MIFQKMQGKVATHPNYAAGPNLWSPGLGSLEQFRAMIFNQTTAGASVNIGSPSDVSLVFSLDLANRGTQDITVIGLGVVKAGACVRATWSGSAWSVAAASAAGSIADWSTATTYAAGDVVIDPNVRAIFRSLAAHTSAAVPPSQDALNWTGMDIGQVGQITIGIPARDRNGYLAMSAGRTVNRATYNRLMNIIAPTLDGIGITNASNQIRFDPADRAFFEPGYTLEIPGVPTGTTLTSASAEGNKVGSTYLTQSAIFFRPGVYATGFAIVNNTEVDGPGIDPSSTVTVLKPDQTASMAVVSGVDILTALPGVTSINGTIVGDYVTGPGVPANARVAAFNAQSNGTVGAINFAGLPTVAIQPNAHTLLGVTPAQVATVLARRQFTMTGFGNMTVVSVEFPQDTIGGSWDYVTNNGFYSPWDITPADTAKLVQFRRVSGGSVTEAVNSDLAAGTSPAATLNGGVVAGSPNIFWQTGQTFPVQWGNRKLGNTSGAIPVDAFVATVTNTDAASTIGSITGTARAFFATGFAVTGGNGGVVGQYLTSAGAGFTQARVLSVVAEVTQTNSGTVTGVSQLYMQPGVALANLSAGQRVTGSGIPANTTITALGAELTVPNSFWPTAAATFSVQPGFTALTLGMKVTGTGRVAGGGNLINAVTAESSYATTYALTGNTSLFLPPAASLTGIVTNRIISSVPWAANTRTSGAPQAGAALTNVLVPASSSIAYLAGGTTLPASGVVGGAVRFPGSAPGFTLASITAVTAADGSLRGSIGNGSSVLRTTPLVGPSGTPTLAHFNPNANFVAGRGISVTGAVAGARIASVDGPASLGTAAVNGFATVTHSGWTGRALTAADVGCSVSTNGGGVPFQATITAVLSPTSFQTGGNGSSTFNGAVATTVIGHRITLDTNATGTVANATGTLAPFLTLDTANTSASAQTTNMEVLSRVPLVNAAGAATAPTPPGLYNSPAVLGAIYGMSGASSAVNTYGTATVGAAHTLSAAATATGNFTATLGRWIGLDASATATVTATPATFGAISTMSANATATSTVPITYGVFAPMARPNATQRAFTGVNLGAMLTANGNASATNVVGIVLGPWMQLTAPATATNGAAAITVGGNVSIDAPATGTQVDQTYNWGATWTMSANATVTNQNATGRVFPFGAGDGSTTFGVGAGTVLVGATARTLTIYAGA